VATTKVYLQTILKNHIKPLLFFAKIMKILNPATIDPTRITNIVFDWGGVITNINYHATVDAFSKIGHYNFEKFFTHHHQDNLFKNFEKGLVKPEELITSISNEIGKDISRKDIEIAWCAMLLDTPPARLEILKKLKDKYKIYLLSNTNSIHANYYTNLLRKLYNIDFPFLFQKVYYSYEVGMRKPDLEIFEFVITDSRLDPQSTLFIDDTEINIQSADAVGMQALFLKSDYSIEKIFNSWVE
jgi:glucose-1-phosphatase